MVPPTSQVAASVVTVTGKDPDGNSVQLVATQQLVNVVSPIQVKLLDHTPLIELDHPFSRFLTNRIRGTVDLADIHGAVTDGMAKAIQIVADKLKPNVPVSVSLADRDFVESADGVGELVFGTQHGTSMSVTPDQYGHLELFYTPPDTFIRDNFRKYDFDAETRGVTLSLHQEDVGTMTRSIDLRRPPVFLAHGLWGTIHVWKYFAPIVPPGQVMNQIIDTSLQYWFNSTWTDSNAQYFTPRKAFDGRMDIIAVGKPGASGHYVEGVKDLREQIKMSLQEYLKGYAIGKVDLVGHSMGGVLSTKMTNENPAIAAAVRKLIVLNSPLKGSPLADWVVDQRTKIHPIKFDSNPVDFFNLDISKGIKDGAKSAFKVDYCNLGLKLFGVTPAFNIYNGAMDDLKTTSISPAFSVPTHYISTWTTGADLGYSAETTGLWTMLGYFCNITPEQNTIEKTKLVKISAEIAKTLFGLAGSMKEESTATKFLSSGARKGMLTALKGGMALAADHAILGEDPTPIFGTQANDRVVSAESQRGRMTSGDPSLTELTGNTDHQAAKITPKVPISACIGVDANGLPTIINAGPQIHDLNGDGQPDIGCRVIQLLEAPPTGSLFKQP